MSRTSLFDSITSIFIRMKHETIEKSVEYQFFDSISGISVRLKHETIEK